MLPGRSPAHDSRMTRLVAQPYRCSDCGYKLVVWWQPPGDGPGRLRQALARTDAERAGLDFHVIDPGRHSTPNASGQLPPPFDCPGCGGQLRPTASAN